MSDRIIKSRDIKLVDPQESMSGEFVEMVFELEGGSDNGGSKTDVIRVKAKKRIEIAREEAYKKGFSEGKEEGIEIEKKKLSLTLNTFTKLVEELSKLKKEILEGSEEEVLNLTISVAEKVIHQEVSTERGVILSVLKESIKNILDREEMKIRLNPKDYSYLVEVDPWIFRNFDDIKNVAFEEDEGIKQGSAIIETLFGEVDARLDQQLSEIKNGLKSKV